MAHSGVGLRFHLCCIVVLALAPVARLRAQPATRAEEIEAERKKKAAHLEPEKVSRLEQALLTINQQKLLERIGAGVGGFGFKLGGLATGSGFAFGPEYLRRDLADGQVVFRGSARVSTKAWQLYDLELDLPKLLHERATAQLYAVHRNYASLGYYGPGPGSRKTGRSDYRFEDTSFDGRFMLRPARYFWIGATAGYTDVNVGPGTDDHFVSTEKIYSPAVTPGIDRQSNFVRGGFIAQYDSRDLPGEPRKGGNYIARYSWYSDRQFDSYSFRRLDLEIQRYQSFFNGRRVFSFRGKTALTDADAGQVVPFYFQPVLGGSDDLRGFRPYRFHDNNLVVFNGEYRWEVFSGLDMAIFGDAGKVFPKRGQLNFKNLEGSYGFGFRFNVRNEVFLRLDVGFSREGFQIWVKFNNIF